MSPSSESLALPVSAPALASAYASGFEPALAFVSFLLFAAPPVVLMPPSSFVSESLAPPGVLTVLVLPGAGHALAVRTQLVQLLRHRRLGVEEKARLGLCKIAKAHCGRADRLYFAPGHAKGGRGLRNRLAIDIGLEELECGGARAA